MVILCWINTTYATSNQNVDPCDENQTSTQPKTSSILEKISRVEKKLDLIPCDQLDKALSKIQEKIPTPQSSENDKTVYANKLKEFYELTQRCTSPPTAYPDHGIVCALYDYENHRYNGIGLQASSTLVETTINASEKSYSTVLKYDSIAERYSLDKENPINLKNGRVSVRDYKTLADNAEMVGDLKFKQLPNDLLAANWIGYTQNKNNKEQDMEQLLAFGICGSIYHPVIRKLLFGLLIDEKQIINNLKKILPTIYTEFNGDSFSLTKMGEKSVNQAIKFLCNTLTRYPKISIELAGVTNSDEPENKEFLSEKIDEYQKIMTVFQEELDEFKKKFELIKSQPEYLGYKKSNSKGNYSLNNPKLFLDSEKIEDLERSYSLVLEGRKLEGKIATLQALKTENIKDYNETISNSETLRNYYKNKLDKVREWSKEFGLSYPNPTEADYSFLLSKKRAQLIAKKLMSCGVKKSQITFHGTKAGGRLQAPTDSEDDYLNRRVDINYILSKP